MSDPHDSGDKPVVHEKNPHNYRKVGYSMIVISVSLVAIGLLVWAVGDNYHFSSDIMAAQEVDAMTPKNGYAVVVFDYTQPIGAKLKLISMTNDLSEALKTQADEAQKYVGQKPMALVFDSSKSNNTSTVALAEVYALSPSDGYRVISFNTALPVGAKLSNLKDDDLMVNATDDAQFAGSQITDPVIHIIIFDSNFDDNLKQILGDKYSPDLVTNNMNKFPEKPHVPKPVVVPPVVNTTQTAPTPTVNQTAVVPLTNSTIPANNAITSVPESNQTVTTNQTAAPVVTSNSTQVTNQTAVPSNQTQSSTPINQTSSNSTQTNQAGTNSAKTVNLSENISINSTGH